MIGTTKKELSVSLSFIDKEGNRLNSPPEEVIEKMTAEQKSKLKALIMEATTGLRHKPVNNRDYLEDVR